MKLEFVMKEFEGKTVYLRPTGNKARHNPGRIDKAVVDKVARVFVTLTFEGRNCQSKYRFDGCDLNDEHNGGYIVFASRKEVEDKLEVERLAKIISSKYRYQSNYSRLSLDKITQIAVLLGINF